MVRRLDNDEEEMSAIELVSRRRASRSNVPPDPAVVERSSRWRANAPWVAGDAIWAMAKAGIEPDSDTGRQASRTAVRTRARRGTGMHQPGDVVHAKQVRQKKEPLFGGKVLRQERRGFDTDFGRGALAGTSVATGLGTALRGGTRGVTTALAALPEAMTAGFRERAQGVEDRGLSDLLWYRPEEDSPRADFMAETTLGQAATQAVAGEKIDLGRGFLPGGSAAVRQAEAARAAMPTIDGSAVTPGRYFAAQVVEPGSKPFTALSGLVDLSVAVVADPTAIALRAGSTAARSRNLFVAGGIDGTRRTVLPDVVASWKESRDGVRVREFLAGTDDFNRIWKDTGEKLPVRTVAELQQARTVREVDDILDPILGLTVREKPTVTFGQVGGLGGAVRRRTESIRMFQTMPGSSLPVDDIDAAVKQLDSFQRNAKLPAEVISVNNAKLARATSPQEIYDVVVGDVLGGVNGALTAAEVPAPIARRLTTSWKNYHEKFSAYFVDEIGENAAVPGVQIDGAGKALPTPHLYVEYLNGAIPLPDARDIRRATSSLGRITGKSTRNADEAYAQRLGVAFGDFFMQDIWKPMALIRGAWTVRVIGEEQVRMAASGLSSVFHHPLSHIAGMVGQRAAARGSSVTRGAEGILGDELRLADEMQAAMSNRSQAIPGQQVRQRSTITTKYKDTYDQEHPLYNRSRADELAQLHVDPIASRLAGGLRKGDRTPGTVTGNHLLDVKDWFLDGAGRKFLDDFTAADARFADRAFAESYIDSVMDRIRIKTGKEPELIEAVATGRLRGQKIGDAGFAEKLDAFRLTGPQKVKGDLVVTGRVGTANEVGERLDSAVEFMFNILMSRPTNQLSRSPAFRQFYWQRVGELMPSMSSADQARILRDAKAAKLPGAQYDDLARRAKLGSGELAMDDVDVIAKGFGLDETRNLLYDLSQRSQFFDITRTIFPFGEAWKEVLTTWAKIGVQNPSVVRRAQQGVEGARGAGFFYQNENGEEVFAYPGSAWLSEQVIGVPVPLTGRVAGLSLATEVLPGVGPVVQIPAAAIIPETPEWDEFREIINPFGSAGEQGEGGFAESQLPAWLQKLRASGYFSDLPFGDPSPDQQRLLANTATDIMRYQVTSGQVDRPDTPDEVRELFEDSMDKARRMYLLRGAAQFGAPTAPTPEAVAVDKNGNLMVAQVMINDYFAMQQDEAAGGYETAFERFLDKYGDDAFILTQGKSASLTYNAPVTTDGSEWQRSNPDLARRFKNTYGLFAPTTGDFDFNAYSRQFRTGEREAINPEMALQLANNRVAAYLYDKAKASLSEKPTREERAWLREYRSALVEDYPGFGDQPGLPKKAELRTVIAELERAAEHPKLRDTEAGVALGKYLQARSLAQEDAVAAGVAGFASAKVMRPTRDWLRDYGDALVEDYPGFGPMWEQVFSREMAEDDASEEEG